MIKDATSSAAAEDLEAQFELLMSIFRTYSAATESINTMRRYRSQLAELAGRLAAAADSGELAERADELQHQVLEIEKGILLPELREGWAGRVNQGTDPLRRLAGLPAVVSLGDYPPTEQAQAVYVKLKGQIEARIKAFEDLRRTDTAALNQRLRQQGVSLIG